MASAVLASRRNEQKFGDVNAFMKNYPPNRALIRNNLSKNPNPSFNPPFPHAENSHFRDFHVSVNVDKDSYRREFVSFDLGSFSRYNLKELKNRLISELKRVRGTLKRIESREVGGFSGGIAMAKARECDKVLGQKRVKAGGSAREAKRRGVDSRVSAMKKCREALVKLMNLKSAVPFNQPVDVQVLQLPDYNLIIKNPMDLGTIKLKLEKNRYRTPKAFAADVRLTFDNAMLYNHKGSKVYVSADKLLMRFEQLFDPIAKSYDTQFGSVKVSAKPVPNVLPDSIHSVEPEGMLVSEKPVSKLRDVKKREMRIEEKQELVERLQEMPPEVAACMVHILRGRNPNLMLEGDEIELDMEALDVETLWELERFVAKYKNGSKMGEQKLIDNLGSVSDLKKHSSVIDLVPDNVHVNKKWGEVEEDIDIGEEILVGNFPSVVIEKDVVGPNNCGSSSSSSSSSSSDSDSHSSTDSGSSGSSSSDSEEATVQSPFVEPAKEA